MSQRTHANEGLGAARQCRLSRVPAKRPDPGASSALSFVSPTVVAQPAVGRLEKEEVRPAQVLHFVGGNDNFSGIHIFDVFSECRGGGVASL